MSGYFEVYGCGCISLVVNRKSRLLGYCGKHGSERTELWRDNVRVRPADEAAIARAEGSGA